MRINLLKKLALVFCLFQLCSCAFISKLKSEANSRNLPLAKPKQTTYFITDNSGEFTEVVYAGYKNKKTYVVKSEMYFKEKLDKGALEKTISFSRIKKRSKIKVLQPELSRFLVWIDGKKHYSEISIDYKNKRIKVDRKSPEPRWQGVRTVELPVGNGLYCFYNQVIECARLPGFVRKALKHKSGKMNFYLIMNGYPYFQELFPDVPQSIAFPATLSLDGKVEGYHRFLLEFAGHTQVLLVDKSLTLVKKFWISQGYSKVKE